MKVIFRKIQNDHSRLRDDKIEGETHSLPRVGFSFLMFAPPRDAGDIRTVRTSSVTEIISQKDNLTIFKTKSGSTYSVEELK